MEERLIAGFEHEDSEIAGKIIDMINNNALKSSLKPVFSVQDILTCLMDIRKCNDDEAKSLLIKAFMKSNELLESVGIAIDHGIRVLMASKADYAVPNLKAYEIGTILELIGVEALSMPLEKYFEGFSG